jgi:phosphoglycolate phosphatase
MAGVIGFDLDLTLIDSRAQILDSFAAVAAATTTPIDLDEVEARLGLKLEDELAIWFKGGEIAHAAEIYRARYRELAARDTVALPGAHAALASVGAAGWLSAIVTAKHASSIEPCLTASGLRADQVHPFVHGPEKAEVLARIGAKLYVGDTPQDMGAALAAGALAIGVTTGVFGSDALAAAGAHVVIGTLEDFPELLTSPLISR